MARPRLVGRLRFGRSSTSVVGLVLAIALAAACGSSAAPSTGLGQTPGAAAGSPGSSHQSCAAQFGAGDTTLALDAADVQRTALMHVPTTLPIAPVPVVVVFHGYGGLAANAARDSGFSAKADALGFVAVYPQGVGGVWHIPGYPASQDLQQADLEFFKVLLARFGASGCIDMGRIFVAGGSQGGGMAATLACTFADRIAAAAVVAGEYFAPPCLPVRAIPIVAFHALDDPVLPYAGGHIPDTAATEPDVLPVEAVAADWAQDDGCAATPVEEPVGHGIVRLSWRTCQAPVVLYRLPSGGHDWPGSTSSGSLTASINATDVIWDFFAASPSP